MYNIIIIVSLILLFLLFKESCFKKEQFNYIGNGTQKWFLPPKYKKEDWDPDKIGIF